jgi:hypothetical protein
MAIVTAMEAIVSKLMLGFLLLCSMAIYNPEGVRDFAHQNASAFSSELRSALYTMDRMLPSFLRFGRG